MERITFEHQISSISVRITIRPPDGEGISIGTGFLFRLSMNDGTNRGSTLLVSNKHVFMDGVGDLEVSLNRKNAEGGPSHGNIRSFIMRNFREGYIPHPDPQVDLACVNVCAIDDTDVYRRNLNDVFLGDIDYSKIFIGAEVLFVGYPANRYDVVNNLPLTRKGSIASDPEIDFNGNGHIVIDAQVFQGSSGSPVFVRQDDQFRLLGVVSQTMIRHSKLQTLNVGAPAIGVQEILGLGIVIKQRHVKELFDFARAEILRLSLNIRPDA